MSNLNPGGLTRVLNYIKTWVTGLLNGKANSSHSHTKSQITDFPTIPTVNNATLTIQKNGTTVNSFTANASSNVTANITVPTKVSELTNDSGYITSSGSCNYANYSGYVQGNKSTGLYVESVKYGNALVTTNQSGFGAIFNAPTKNYRIGCATYPNNDDTLLFYSVTNANVSSSTNTVNKSMSWNGGTGILTATGFSGPLTGNVTGNCSGSSGSCTGNAANVTGTVAIGHGGTGATTRLGAVQNLTNENVGTSTEYFLTITTNWGKAGYCSVANAKSVLGAPTNTNQLTNGAGFITSSGSCNYANSAGYATTSAKLIGDDTRNNNYTPANYINAGQQATIRAEFKTRSTLGAPGDSTFGTSVTITPWRDNSGGRSVQLYFSDSYYTSAIRFATGDSSWSSWYWLNTEYLTKLNGYRIYVG